MFNEIKNFQPDFLVEKFSVKQSLSADFRTTPEAPVNENFLTGKLCEKTCILSSGKSYGPYLFVFFLSAGIYGPNVILHLGCFTECLV